MHLDLRQGSDAQSMLHCINWLSHSSVLVRAKQFRGRIISEEGPYHETQSADIETLQIWSFDKYVFEIFGYLSEGTAFVIIYYISWLAMLFLATLFFVVRTMERKQTEPESEKDAQKQT